MGQLHNELRRGPLSNALAGALGDTRGGGLERYGETLQPTLNLWREPEWAYLRHEKLGAIVRIVAAGGAATFSGAALVNPANSGMLVVCTAWTSLGVALSGVAVDWHQALDADIQVSFGSSQLGFHRDSRWGVNGRSVALVRYGTPAATPTAVQIESAIHSAANTMLSSVVSVPCVLHPGRALFAILRSANLGAEFSIQWRERRALPGELVELV